MSVKRSFTPVPAVAAYTRLAGKRAGAALPTWLSVMVLRSLPALTPAPTSTTPPASSVFAPSTTASRTVLFEASPMNCRVGAEVLVCFRVRARATVPLWPLTVA